MCARVLVGWALLISPGTHRRLPTKYATLLCMPYKDKEARYAQQERHRKTNFQKLAEYLSSHPCVDCGEDDLIVLDFDHLPEYTKKFEIARAVAGSTRSWSSILVEIGKCEVVCANCHRRRTASRGEYKRFTYVQINKPL